MPLLLLLLVVLVMEEVTPLLLGPGWRAKHRRLKVISTTFGAVMNQVSMAYSRQEAKKLQQMVGLRSSMLQKLYWDECDIQMVGPFPVSRLRV